MVGITERARSFIDSAEAVEVEQRANIKTKEHLEKAIAEKVDESKLNSKDLEIVTNAIAILRQVSDDAVQQSYLFITDSINAALERIFEKTTRRIRLKEYTRAGMYPQLEVELTVENGSIRSLKDDSGHGIMQIISLLCILSLIVITGSRKILVVDEMLSGLSSRSRSIVDDILWSFTEIGFQFIISEHGYTPKGSKVYHLEMSGGVSRVIDTYIESKGTYLEGLLGRGAEDESDEQVRGEVLGALQNGQVIHI